MIQIVNEKDEIIGYEEREAIKPGMIYRVSALWVKDQNENILLAQRSFKKKNDPGLWGPSVAGTVEMNESYESNIIKEAEEEIGLLNIKPILGPKFFREKENRYFVQWYYVTVESGYNFIKQDDEVENIKWFSKSEINEILSREPEVFLPDFAKYLDYF